MYDQIYTYLNLNSSKFDNGQIGRAVLMIYIKPLIVSAMT